MMEDMTPGGIPYPWLAVDYGENQQALCDVVCNTAPRIARTVPEWILVSPTNQAGWFINADSVSDSDPIHIFLWNAVTLQSIALPRLDREFIDSVRFVLLTETPDHPDCTVLLWVDYGIVFSHMNDGHGWTHRDYLEQLTQLTSLPPDSDDDDSDDDGGQMYDFEAAVVCDDKNIYMMLDLGEDFLLMRIEIVKPKTLVITPLPCKRPQSTCELGCEFMPFNQHWVSWSNDLVVIRINCCGVSHKVDKKGSGEEIVSVTLLKLNFSDMSWNIVDTCSNVAFFINHRYPYLSYSAYSAEAGNRVYMLFDETKWLYTYHIQENTLLKTPLASLLPSPDIGPPSVEQAELYYPYWVTISDHQPLEKAGKVYYCSGSNDKEDRSSLINANDENKLSLTEINLIDLPPDILKVISCCLNNPVHYLTFRAACKIFSSLLPPNGWRETETSVPPWLIIPSVVENGDTVVVDPVSSSKYYLRTWLDYGSQIGYSSNGWLLIQSSPFKEETGKCALRLYNPMTKSTICIPTPPGHSSHYLFTSSPNTDNCKVIGVSMYLLEFFFIQLGRDNNQWDRELVELGRGEEVANLMLVNQSNINPVCIRNSHFYFFVGEENLAAIVCLADGYYAYEKHHFTAPCNSSFEQRFLIESEDRLISIYIGNEWLKVFSLNESEMVWQEVIDLNNNNIYLSSPSCIMREPEFQEMGNRVYLPRFHQGRIVYYSFNTHKFHAGEGDSSVVSYYETKEQLRCCWFEPNWN